MKLFVWSATLSCLLLASASHANKLYRFNVEGRVIVKDHVPAQYAHMGYEILNNAGLVLKKVAPAPTAEELAERRAAEKAEKIRTERVSVQRKIDMDLLRLYSKPEDVERARKRKADEIESYIQLQHRRITDLEGKLEISQGDAANIERRGIEIPVDLRLEIAQLQNRIRESHENIKTRQQEMIESTKAFSTEYERIRILQVYKPGVLEEDIDLDKVDRKLGTL